MNIPRVLIVEDRKDMQNLFLEQLSGKVDLVLVETIEFAEKVVSREDEHFDAIAIDACVPGNEINVLPLLAKICSKYSCPKIAISSYDKYNQELMVAGCTHKVDKKGLLKFLLQLL